MTPITRIEYRLTFLTLDDLLNAAAYWNEEYEWHDRHPVLTIERDNSSDRFVLQAQLDAHPERQEEERQDMVFSHRARFTQISPSPAEGWLKYEDIVQRIAANPPQPGQTVGELEESVFPELHPGKIDILPKALHDALLAAGVPSEIVPLIRMGYYGDFTLGRPLPLTEEALNELTRFLVLEQAQDLVAAANKAVGDNRFHSLEGIYNFLLKDTAPCGEVEKVVEAVGDFLQITLDLANKPDQEDIIGFLGQALE